MRIQFACIVWFEQLDSPCNKGSVTGFCLWELRKSPNCVKEKYMTGILEGTSNMKKKKKKLTHQLNALPSFCKRTKVGQMITGIKKMNKSWKLIRKQTFKIFKLVTKLGVFWWLSRKSKKVRMFREKSAREGSYFYISSGIEKKNFSWENIVFDSWLEVGDNLE